MGLQVLAEMETKKMSPLVQIAYPLIFMAGTLGLFWLKEPIAASVCLGFAIIVAFHILPTKPKQEKK